MFFSQLDFNCNYTPGADISRLGSIGPSICFHGCVAVSPSSSMFKGRKLDESLPARSEPAQTTNWRKIHNNSNIIIGYNCYYDYNYVYATRCAFLHVSSSTGYAKKRMEHKTRKQADGNYIGGLLWEVWFLFIFPRERVQLECVKACDPRVKRVNRQNRNGTHSHTNWKAAKERTQRKITVQNMQ